MHVSGNHHVEVEATISNFNLNFIFSTGKRGAISAMHVQRMYYSATYFQFRYGTGSEPLTRDPTRSDPYTFWPVDPTRSPMSVLWIERLFWRKCATSECFLPKSLWSMQHTCRSQQFPTLKSKNKKLSYRWQTARRI